MIGVQVSWVTTNFMLALGVTISQALPLRVLGLKPRFKTPRKVALAAKR